MKKTSGIIMLLTVALLCALSFMSLAACGSEKPTKGLLYTLINNGKAYSVSIGAATDTKIIIPSKHNNLPVTQIDEYGFAEDKSKITSVKIPNSIVDIGNSAFSGCGKLKTINLPNSITAIHEMTFYGCGKLKTINLPNSIAAIYEMAFYGCKKLNGINIPDSVEYVDNSAFGDTGILNNAPDNSVVYAGKWAVYYKGVISNVVLKPDTRGIARGAFVGGDLTSLIMPNSVLFMDDLAFLGSDNLTIYAESASKQDGWSDAWNYSSFTYSPRPVIWGCTLSEDKAYVVSFTKSENSIENLDECDIGAPFRYGYTFGGWSISPDSQTLDYLADEIETAPNNAVLYAIWVKN